MLGPDCKRDSTAGGELRGYDRFTRSARIDEIIQDTVRDCFVERALVSIRGQIKLQRLALHADTVGHVIDVDPREIRLACDRTDRSEIIRFKMNPIISARRRIRKRFEARFCGRGWQLRVAPPEQRQLICAFSFCHGDVKVRRQAIEVNRC